METIESFQKSNLKTVETVVKASLPDQDDVAQEKEIIEAETEQNKEVFGKDNYFFQFWFDYQSCYSKSIFNIKNLLNHLFMIFLLD